MSNTGEPKPTEAEPYPSPIVGWAAVIVLFLLVVLSVLDRNILTLLVDPIKEDLGITDVHVVQSYGVE